MVFADALELIWCKTPRVSNDGARNTINVIIIMLWLSRKLPLRFSIANASEFVDKFEYDAVTVHLY